MGIALTTDKDIAILKDLIKQVRDLKQNQDIRDEAHHIQQASEVYIAHVPAGTVGIPAMAGDTPGSAECDIFRISDTTGDVEQITGLTKLVYNISDEVMTADPILIAKTKGGKWIALRQNCEA